MNRAKSEREQAFLGPIGDVAVPETAEQLAEAVREAEVDGRSVVPVGLGAHTGTADLPENPLLISAAALDRIVNYEPDDFTVGAEAGVPLARLREELAGHGQELPVDLGVAAAGTVGGLVARAPIGPRTHRHGSVSSLLLGAEGIRGGGRAWQSGGMVVKNVAGYQLGKLMVGSLGQAGVITRVNFRLRPIPQTRSLRCAAGDESAVAACSDALKRSGLEPTLAVLRGGLPNGLRDAGLPIPPGEVAIAWLFEGSEARVNGLSAAAMKVVDASRSGAVTTTDKSLDVGPENREVGRAFLDQLADFAAPRGAPLDDGLLRLTVLPSRVAEAARAVMSIGPTEADGTSAAAPPRSAAAAPCATAAVGSWEDPFLGTLVVRWTAADLTDQPIAPWTEVARRHGGAARLLSLPPSLRGQWNHRLVADPNAALADRFLDVFDPERIFRGRVT